MIAMKDTEYTFAVARIRANETRLINRNELEQMIAAPDVHAVLQLLSDKGWDTAGAPEDTDRMLRRQTQALWQLMEEAAPDIRALTFLLAKHDFHNLKAALKCTVSARAPEPYWLEPATVPPADIWAAVCARRFGSLPGEMQSAAQEAYDLLVRAGDSQRADSLLDRAALEAVRSRAAGSGSDFAGQIAERICAAANLKIALRAACTGRDERFLQAALCECETLNKHALAAAAARGRQELAGFLSQSAYAGCVPAAAGGFAAFEKWCDDMVFSRLEGARLVSFGPAPLIAYYIAREREIQNIRILLSCKRLGLPAERIRERMREAYV